MSNVEAEIGNLKEEIRSLKIIIQEIQAKIERLEKTKIHEEKEYTWSKPFGAQPNKQKADLPLNYSQIIKLAVLGVLISNSNHQCLVVLPCLQAQDSRGLVLLFMILLVLDWVFLVLLVLDNKFASAIEHRNKGQMGEQISPISKEEAIEMQRKNFLKKSIF